MLMLGWTNDFKSGLLANFQSPTCYYSSSQLCKKPHKNTLLIFKSGTKIDDFHNEMNSHNYKMGYMKNLPNLPGKSVLL